MSSGLLLWVVFGCCFLFSLGSNGLQLAFEITVISFTAYNALSFPRDHRTPLGRILYRDGMMFFVVSRRRHYPAQAHQGILGRRVIPRAQYCFQHRDRARAHLFADIVRGRNSRHLFDLSPMQLFLGRGYALHASFLDPHSLIRERPHGLQRLISRRRVTLKHSDRCTLLRLTKIRQWH